MATITKRPNKTGTYGNDLSSQSYLYDTNETNYATRNAKGNGKSLLYYDFSSIPANSIVSDISIFVKCDIKGSIDCILCKDSTSASSGDYTPITDTVYSFFNTPNGGVTTATCHATNEAIAEINKDIGILRTAKRFSVRLHWYKLDQSTTKFYEVQVTITYGIPHNISTTVFPSGSGSVSGAGTYVENSSITLTATPASRYQFVKWQKDGVDDGNTSATRTITVSGDATYTAVFKLSDITVSFDASGGTVSTLSKSVTPGSTYGTLPTPTRTGYEFMGWYKTNPVYDGGFLRNNQAIALGRTYMYTDKLSIHLEAYLENWSTIVNKNIMSCTEGGGWGIGYQANTTGHGAEIYIQDKGYKGIDFGIASLSSGWHTFDVIFDGNNFVGYVDGVQKGSVATGGTAIKYHTSNGIFIGAEAGSSAETAAGNYFNGDLGTIIISNDNTITSAVTSSTTVTATEAHTLYATWRIKHYTTSTTSINGLVNGQTSYSTTNPYGEQITLTATPNTGYEFTKWSDNSTTNPKTLTVTSNNSYVANFAFINKIYSGTAKLSGIYVGTTPVKAVYIGTTKIYDNT